jgi:hypothetical protein
VKRLPLRGAHRWLAALVATAAVVGAGAGATVGFTSTVGAQANEPLYGVTIDSVKTIAAVVTGVKNLPYRPTVRVVFTWVSTKTGSCTNATGTKKAVTCKAVSPTTYKSALEELDAVATVMGELLDSSFTRGASVSVYTADVRNYVTKLGAYVNIWEIGNEINGDWTGNPATNRLRIKDAYTDIHSAGGKTAITFYESDFGSTHCGNDESDVGDTDAPAATMTMFPYGKALTSTVRDGVNYVLLSWYPGTCTGIKSKYTKVTTADVASQVKELHGATYFPNASIGFGELGYNGKAYTKLGSSAKTLDKDVMAWGYSLNPATVDSTITYYIGGYFWWYGYEDVFTGKKALFTSLVNGFKSENTALG